MTNDDVITFLAENAKWSCIAISTEMNDFIKKNYTEGNSEGNERNESIVCQRMSA